MAAKHIPAVSRHYEKESLVVPGETFWVTIYYCPVCNKVLPGMDHGVMKCCKHCGVWVQNFGAAYYVGDTESEVIGLVHRTDVEEIAKWQERNENRRKMKEEIKQTTKFQERLELLRWFFRNKE